MVSPASASCVARNVRTLFDVNSALSADMIVENVGDDTSRRASDDLKKRCQKAQEVRRGRRTHVHETKHRSKLAGLRLSPAGVVLKVVRGENRVDRKLAAEGAGVGRRYEGGVKSALRRNGSAEWDAPSMRVWRQKRAGRAERREGF
mgnify:FL=1